MWSPNNDNSEQVTIENSSNVTEFTYTFTKTVRLNTVISMIHGSSGSHYWVVGSPTIDIIANDRITGVRKEHGAWITNYFYNWRDSNSSHFSKFIFLSDCLADEWTTPTTWSPTTQDNSQDVAISNLAYYNECDNVSINLTDLTLEAHDQTGIQTGVLSWVTIDTASGITISPTTQEFYEYRD